MGTKKSKMGRPPLPVDQAKSVRLFCRVTPALYGKLVQAAEQAGLPLATYVTQKLETIIGS